MLDSETGLIWLKDTSCIIYRESWADANIAAAGLKDGDCALEDGSSPGDWRLPTKDEWEATIAAAVALFCGFPSLMDTAGTGCFSTETQPLFVVEPDNWSSTTFADDPDYAWSVHLGMGGVFDVVKTNANFWWPVRGGQ